MIKKNNEIDYYRSQFAKKIIFGSLNDKRIAQLKVERDGSYVYLSQHYLNRNALASVKRLGIISTIVLSSLLVAFLYFYIQMSNPLVQIGTLVIATAFLLMFLGVSYKICEATIHEEDIIVRQNKTF